MKINRTSSLTCYHVTVLPKWIKNYFQKIGSYCLPLFGKSLSLAGRVLQLFINSVAMSFRIGCHSFPAVLPERSVKVCSCHQRAMQQKEYVPLSDRDHSAYDMKQIMFLRQSIGLIELRSWILIKTLIFLALLGIID